LEPIDQRAGFNWTEDITSVFHSFLQALIKRDQLDALNAVMRKRNAFVKWVTEEGRRVATYARAAVWSSLTAMTSLLIA